MRFFFNSSSCYSSSYAGYLPFSERWITTKVVSSFSFSMVKFGGSNLVIGFFLSPFFIFDLSSSSSSSPVSIRNIYLQAWVYVDVFVHFLFRVCVCVCNFTGSLRISIVRVVHGQIWRHPVFLIWFNVEWTHIGLRVSPWLQSESVSFDMFIHCFIISIIVSLIIIIIIIISLSRLVWNRIWNDSFGRGEEGGVWAAQFVAEKPGRMRYKRLRNLSDRTASSDQSNPQNASGAFHNKVLVSHFALAPPFPANWPTKRSKRRIVADHTARHKFRHELTCVN